MGVFKKTPMLNKKKNIDKKRKSNEAECQKETRPLGLRLRLVNKSLTSGTDLINDKSS